MVVATGTDPTARGVVMAASYEARKFGVHSALPLAIAHRRCPQAVLVPRDMERYREVSGEVMAIVRRHSDRVEVVGLDEAYLDSPGDCCPKTDCRRIKHEIREETGLVCSIGLAPNKLLAKIASDLDKPDGFCVLRPEQMLEAVGDRPASLIPGVGPKTVERLAPARDRTVAELARAPDRRCWSARSGRASAPSCALAPTASTSARWRRSASGSPRAARRPSRTTSTTATLLRETLDRLAARVCEGLVAQRLSRPHRDAEDPAAAVPHLHALADARGADRAMPTSCAPVARELLGRVDIDAPVRLLGVGLSGLERETSAEDGRLFAAEA